MILVHASTWEVSPAVGDELTLRIGRQGAQGAGVYFALNALDVRASDSCQLHGLKRVFRVSAQEAQVRDWYRSKASRDAKKGRPQTWHSNGSDVRIRVCAISADGVTIDAILLS